MARSDRSTLGAAALAALLSTPVLAQDDRPNILLILFDDVGFMDFGAYGSDTRTPTIDALAQQGAMLSRFHSSPSCGPSRAMLLTGMDNHQVGMGSLVETVPDEFRAYPGYTMLWDDDQSTIASLLRDAGYQTYVSGKWGIGEIGENLPDRFGFDRSFVMDATGGSNYDMTPYLPGYSGVDWYEDGESITLPEDFYSSRDLVDRMIDYIDGGDPGQPFFGFLSLQAVHIPVQVPVDYIDAYDGVFDAGWDAMREDRLDRAINLGLVPDTTELAPVPETHEAWDALTAEERAVAKREMQANAGMITAADEHIGRLLDHLEATGALENTIVIVTSDNGPESGQTSFEGPRNALVNGVKWIEGWDDSPENIGQPASLTAIGPEWASVSAAPFHLYKFYSTEGGIRVPLVAAGPGITASGIIDAPVHVADLLPTLLEVASVPFDTDAFYGRSALPLLTGAAEQTWGDDAFGFEVSGSAALYRGQWKLTRIAPPIGDSQWQLFDLSTDPGETTDISKEEPEIFDSMRAEYASYAEEVGVVELGPDQSAFQMLASNLTKKIVHAYWPYALGVTAVLLALLYGAFRLIRRRGRAHFVP